MVDRSVDRRWLAWSAAAGWTVLVALLLLAPVSGLGGALDWLPADLEEHLDKLVHFVLFCGQSWFVRPLVPPDDRHRLTALVAFACLAYAVLLEGLQMAVPGRGFELLDIVWGGLGVAAGLALRWRSV